MANKFETDSITQPYTKKNVIAWTQRLKPNPKSDWLKLRLSFHETSQKQELELNKCLTKLIVSKLWRIFSHVNQIRCQSCQIFANLGYYLKDTN